MKKLLFSMLILASGLSFAAKPKPKPKAKQSAPKVVVNPFAEIEKMLANIDVAAGALDTSMKSLENALVGLEGKLATIGSKVKLLGFDQKIEMMRACRTLTKFTQSLRKEYEGSFYYIPDILKSEEPELEKLQKIQRRIDTCYEKISNLSWYKNPVQYTLNMVRHPIQYMQDHKKITTLATLLLARTAIKAYHYGNLPAGKESVEKAGGLARRVFCGY